VFQERTIPAAYLKNPSGLLTEVPFKPTYAIVKPSPVKVPAKSTPLSGCQCVVVLTIAQVKGTPVGAFSQKNESAAPAFPYCIVPFDAILNIHQVSQDYTRVGCPAGWTTNCLNMDIAHLSPDSSPAT